MALSITLRNARTTIENAIIDSLAFAFGYRIAPAADVPTLRSLPSAAISDRSLRFVTATGFAYQWQRAQTGADDGVNFVQPSDVASGNPGRWCKSSLTGFTSQASTGYLKRCDLYNDDEHDLDTIEQRLFGNVPALLLSFEHVERTPKSSTPGYLYWCKYHFTLFAISVNPRGGQTARQGSPIVSEQATDPGTAAMIGDAMDNLAGSTLGIADVAYVQVRDEAPVIRDLARARFVESLDLLVYATLTHQDPTITPMVYPYTFNAQFALADVNEAGAIDTSNDVTTNGLQFALGNSLTQSFAGGTLNFNGSPLAVAGASNTFAANSVTYRDISSTGAITYTAVAPGSPEPALAFGLLRLGVTVTDGTGVRLDRLLASSVINFGPPDKDDPPLVTAIVISPTNTTLPTGTPLQYTATATYQDASTSDATDLVTWASDNANTTLTASGIANTTTPGTAHITGSYRGITSNTATLIAT